MANKSYLRAYSFLALSQIMVGISIVSAKYLLTSLSLFLILQIRFFIGTLFLLALAQLPGLKTKNQTPSSTLKVADFLLIILQALCAGLFFNLLMSSGLKLTSASNAGTITSALPVMITLMSWVFLKEKMTKQKWICVFLASIGICIINLSHPAQNNNAGKIWGDILVLLSLLPEASYYILAKFKHIHLSLITLSIWINLINTIAMLPLTWYELHAHSFAAFSLTDIILLLFLGITTALFYVFWMLGSRNLPTSITSIFTAIIPVSTLLTAWLFLKETISLGNIIGMLFVMGSIFYSAKAMASTSPNLATSPQQANS